MSRTNGGSADALLALHGARFSLVEGAKALRARAEVRKRLRWEPTDAALDEAAARDLDRLASLVVSDGDVEPREEARPATFLLGRRNAGRAGPLRPIEGRTGTYEGGERNA